MKVLFATSEAYPFAMSGGLADVAGALPKALRKRFVGARIILPLYGSISEEMRKQMTFICSITVPVAWRRQYCGVFEAHVDGVIYYFIDNQYYFKRDGLYGYYDDAERFTFFSRAVLEVLPHIDFQPDIIHCNDWQTALIPAYLKTVYKLDAFFTRTRSLLTIHNIAYQGHYPYSSFEKAGFHPVDFTADKFEYYGGMSFLKSGIVFADNVNTVSPNYAKEVQADPSMGFGLEGLLKHRSKNFFGIVNGIDTEIWDPEIDTLLPLGYDAATFGKNKPVSKQLLQEQTGLKKDLQKPLVGVVSRLDYQKGLDLAYNVIERLHEKVQFVVLGMGDPLVEKQYRELAKKYPSAVAYVDRLDEELAHHIYAGADLFLMPSRFEPCGLSQMISMKYGTLPVVSKVGGLVDTVVGYKENSDNAAATGFFIQNFSENSIEAALQQALRVFEDKRTWNKLVKNAMLKDNSWDKSAQDYMTLYKKTAS